MISFVTIGFLNAQKTLDKGYVKMEITNISSDDPQMAMGLEMMKGTQTELYFTKDQYITNMNMMGGMIETKTLINNSAGTMDMLFNAMGQKMWISSTLEEASKGEQAKIAETAKIVEDLNDTKEVLGYKCHAVNITTPEMADMKVKCYVTKEIKTNANLIQGMQALKLNGYPMEFTLTMPTMTMTMAAKEVSENVDDSKFKLNTEGYKKMTMAEFQKQMGGMGAGFGF